MSLTINMVPGTAWPPTPAANTCALAALNEFASWIVGTNSVWVEMNWASISGVATNDGKTNFATTYVGLKSLLNSQIGIDEFPNNIKSTAYGALPGSEPSGTPNSNNWRQWIAHYAVLTNANLQTVPFLGGFVNITLNSGLTFDTSIPTDNSPITGYGMYQAILHEVTEVFGRKSDLTSSEGIADLFAFSAATTHSFSSSGRYCSWDDGVTNIGSYDVGGGNDLGDWAGTETGAGYLGTSTASPFDSVGASGNPQLIRYKDGQALALLYPMTARGLMVCGFPTNNGSPVISGTATQGQILSATNGTWVGQSVITKTFQWKRNGSDIGGATNATYSLTGSDVGANMVVVETASNIIGAQISTSNALGPVLSSGFGVFSFGLKR